MDLGEVTKVEEAHNPLSFVREFKFLLAALILLGAVAGVWYYLSTMREEPLLVGPYIGEATRFAQENESFLQALTATRRGEFGRANSFFEDAYTQAVTGAERAHVRYTQASAHFLGGDAVRATNLFKEVISHPDSSDTQKAYAVASMGRLFYSGRFPGVENEIFKGEPYEEMLVENDVAASFKNLFEYGSTFYPVAYSEFHIALWYAGELVRRSRGEEQKAPNLSNAAVREVIKDHLADGQWDIHYLSNADYKANQRTIAEGLGLKARVAFVLAAAEEKTILPDVDQVYQDALHAMEGLRDKTSEAYLTYFRARYLTLFDTDEARNEIPQLLANFYDSDKFAQTDIERFFTKAKDNIFGARRDVEILAAADPNFKEYLEGLGWTFN